MSRFVVGNRDGTLAVRLGRSVLERLAEEWPDLHLTVKTVPNDPPGAGRDGRTTDSDAEGSWPSHAPNRLVDALTRGAVDVAVIQLGQLSADLPPELTLAAVTRRGDQRSAVVARGYDDLAQVPAGAIVGVGSRRDAAFLRATYPGLVARALTQAPEAELARLSAGDYAAVILPAATLIGLDLREHVDAWLEADTFTPVAGQGAVGLVVRADDDVAFETVYPLQHRPSFDRVRAERAFALALSDQHVGAAATVTDDGELTLFGAVASGETVIQASVSGDAKEAEDLGRELASDVKDRLATL
mgnify:FL=1